MVSLLITFENHTWQQHECIISGTAITLKYFAWYHKDYLEKSSHFFYHSEFFCTQGNWSLYWPFWRFPAEQVPDYFTAAWDGLTSPRTLGWKQQVNRSIVLNQAKGLWHLLLCPKGTAKEKIHCFLLQIVFQTPACGDLCHQWCLFFSSEWISILWWHLQHLVARASAG